MKSWFVVFKEVCVCTSADLNSGCFFLLLFSLQFSLKPFCGEMWRKMVWMLEFLCIRGTVPAALHAQTKTNFFPTDKTFPAQWFDWDLQIRVGSPYFLLSSLCSQLNQQSEAMSPSRKLALDCTQLKTELKIHPLVRLLPRAPRMGTQEDPGVASRQLFSGCSCDLIKPGL